MNSARLKHLLVGEFSIRRCIRSAIFIYASVMVYVYFSSDRMIFPSPPCTYTDSSEIIKLRTEDGVTISALYLEHPGSKFTLLYSHGNAEDLGVIRPVLDEFHRRGYSVLAYDYHGYGTSAGRPTEANACRDIMAAYHFLIHDKGIPAERLIVHGRSVGTGPAMYLASVSPVAGFISESGFVSAFRVVTHIPLVPFDSFPNLKRIKRVSCPILVIHGALDATVPIWHSKRLFAAAHAPKFQLWVENAGHDDVPWSGEEYWKCIDAFLATVQGGLEIAGGGWHAGGG